MNTNPNKDHLSKVLDLVLQSVEEATKVPKYTVISRNRHQYVVQARTMCFYATLAIIFRHEKVSVKYKSITLLKTHIVVAMGWDRTSQYDMIDRHMTYMLHDEYKDVFQKVLDRADELYKSVSTDKKQTNGKSN